MILFCLVTCDAGIEENHLGSGNEEFKSCLNLTEGSECITHKVVGSGRVRFICIDLHYGNGRGNWSLTGYLILCRSFKP